MTEQDRNHSDGQLLIKERYELLHGLEDALEKPLIVLGFLWLLLLVLELVQGENRLFETFGTIIWVVFLLDFGVKFLIAPEKITFLRANWINLTALLLPALRIFRVVRVLRVMRLARAARGLRLVRIVSSLNRGMRALGASMGRRGFGYVIALTLLVTFAGAAGMYAFEKESRVGLHSFGEALWWTAMIMTTMGSQYWPITVEGRVLCVFLSLYAFAVFGYLTATLATYFIGRDAESGSAALAGAKSLATLQADVAALRDDLRVFADRSSQL